MKRITGGVVALALLLAGCRSNEVPAAQTITATATVTATAPAKTVVTTAVKTTATTVTATVAESAAVDFDEVHVEVRTAASPAFDGWPNDVMDRIEAMVCAVQDDRSADTDKAVLRLLGVPEGQTGLTAETIRSLAC